MKLRAEKGIVMTQNINPPQQHGQGSADDSGSWQPHPGGAGPQSGGFQQPYPAGLSGYPGGYQQIPPQQAP